jgi:hypothetical protein
VSLDQPSDPQATPDPVPSAAPQDASAPAEPDGSVAPQPARRVPVSLLTWAGLLVGGLVLGSLGALVQANRRQIGTGADSHTLWWGLVLVVVVLGVCVRAASYLVGSRRGGALVAVGWLVPTLVLAGQGPGGDVILPSTDRSTWYLGASAVVALVALLWPLPKGTRELAAEHRGELRARRAADRRDPEPIGDDSA